MIVVEKKGESGEFLSSSESAFIIQELDKMNSLHRINSTCKSLCLEINSFLDYFVININWINILNRYTKYIN